MARPTAFLLSITLALPTFVCAGTPTSQPAASEPQPSNAAKIRARNYTRPGWFLVDGYWARSQTRTTTDELFTLVEYDGNFHLWADPAPRFDSMLRNGRTALIEIAGSNYGWKLSAPDRTWNDTRSAGSQHLLLVAATDDAKADRQFRLTKIEITPDQQVIQAAVVESDQLTSVILVMGRDFIECSAGRFNSAPSTLVRSTGARQLLADRPIETRRYVVPLLALVNGGRNPLAPSAADVYRAFPNLPLSSQAAATVKALVPDLASPDPAIRRRALNELKSLGRRGVQAAMALDQSKLPPAAAAQIATYLANDSHDNRTVDAMRADSGFILDCLGDPDPNVRAEAGKCSIKNAATQPTPLFSESK